MEREQAEELITTYGGRVMKSVGKTTDYLLMGREFGPAKHKKAMEVGAKCVTEDEFIAMIELSAASSSSSSSSLSLQAASSAVGTTQQVSLVLMYLLCIC